LKTAIHRRKESTASEHPGNTALAANQACLLIVPNLPLTQPRQQVLLLLVGGNPGTAARAEAWASQQRTTRQPTKTKRRPSVQVEAGLAPEHLRQVLELLKGALQEKALVDGVGLHEVLADRGSGELKSCPAADTGPHNQDAKCQTQYRKRHRHQGLLRHGGPHQ
jgi:hypothetical protein